MRKSTVVALAAVALVSIAVRLSPLWSFLYWGSDTGEYFSILRALVRGDHLSTTYYGWGVTYPYFPGMFFAQAGVVDLGGLDVPTTINLLVPILGYANHTDTAGLRRAHTAGFDQVVVKAALNERAKELVDGLVA